MRADTDTAPVKQGTVQTAALDATPPIFVRVALAARSAAREALHRFDIACHGDQRRNRCPVLHNLPSFLLNRTGYAGTEECRKELVYILFLRSGTLPSILPKIDPEEPSVTENLPFNEFRQRLGMSVDEVAREVECDPSTVYRWERGETVPKAHIYRSLEMIGQLRPKPVQEAPSGDLSFRFIDLFAGIGGLRVGFQAIGGHCVFTSEWDKHAQETYRRNFRDNHDLHGDIREFSETPDLIPEHDVLLAGFPCQPFSIAGVSKKNALGRPHGFLCDTQGTLFFDTAQIIAHHRPAAFVLENVKNLESHDGGKTFATIMNVLENELKYKVQARVISSAPWVPQKRERIFIVGFREKTDFNLKMLEIPDASGGPKLGSILERHEDVDPKYTLTPRLWEYLQRYKEKHTSKGNGFGYSLFGPNDVARTLSARYYKDGSEILIDQPGKRPRRLTPLECARLMGFDRGERHWQIGVSDTQAYRQFGNAVVVPVVEFLANAMKPYLATALADNEQPSQEPSHDTQQDRPMADVDG